MSREPRVSEPVLLANYTLLVETEEKLNRLMSEFGKVSMDQRKFEDEYWEE